MRGFIIRGAACAAGAVGLLILAAPSTREATANVQVTLGHGPAVATSAASPAASTFTFKLTISGSPPATDGINVTWGETGLSFCAPCIGGGHTYVQTQTFPEGVTETFNFVRTAGNVTPDHPGQTFGTQTATANGDHIISATFTYGAGSITTPSTGGAPMLAVGAALIGGGAAVVRALLRRR